MRQLKWWIRRRYKESLHRSVSIPPIGARFSYMNETWIAIGWATKPDVDYVWSRQEGAAFVIGQNLTRRLPPYQIAPVDQIQAFHRRSWNSLFDFGALVSVLRVWAARRMPRSMRFEYEWPDYVRVSEGQRANSNVGHRVRVVGGQLELY